MRYRKLTTTGDYTLGHGKTDFYKDVPQAPAQAVATRLRLLAGEWFVDMTEGTPYQTAVLGKHTQATYDPVLRQRILDTEGVTAIVDYQSIFDGEKRTLTVSAVIDTIFGIAAIREVL